MPPLSAVSGEGSSVWANRDEEAVNLRKLAKGKDCVVRLPCCNSNPETVVLAHFRSISLGAGIGHKPPDWLGAHACSACHDGIDGRAKVEGYDKDALRFAHAIGVLKTIERLIDEGYLKW
jgi:hypothetical protein